MKEGAARAVLREAWLRGQRCVELQRDGKKTIFVCTRCGIRCYSDAALVDHLRGNLHSRISAAFTTATPSEKNSRTNNRGGERATAGRGGWEKEEGMIPDQGDRSAVFSRGGLSGGPKIVLAGPAAVAGSSSKTSLEWIGSGELFFSVRPGAGDDAPIVDSSWFFWKGKSKQGPEPGWQGGGIVFAVVMFPYSDMIGRSGNGKLWSAEGKHGSLGIESGNRLFLALPSSNPQMTSPVNSNTSLGQNLDFAAVPIGNNSPTGMQTEVDRTISRLELEKQKLVVSKEVSGRVLRRACKRKKARFVERLCFICHQRMMSGKDVAALLNLQTKQMVCGSRNKRGVFHVYHSSCLIDWISICELKSFTGQLNCRIDHTRKPTRTSWAIVEKSMNQGIQVDGGPLSNCSSNGAIFCPECQGTGLNVRGAQLERPRYRLAQVFDWTLELLQARKTWANNPKKQDTSHCGLLFRDELQGAVQSRGLVHYYSNCTELLIGNALER